MTRTALPAAAQLGTEFHRALSDPSRVRILEALQDAEALLAPALPAIQREYGASTTAVTWVLTVHLLSASIATPVLGRLGDKLRRGPDQPPPLLRWARLCWACAQPSAAR